MEIVEDLYPCLTKPDSVAYREKMKEIFIPYFSWIYFDTILSSTASSPT